MENKKKLFNGGSINIPIEETSCIHEQELCLLTAMMKQTS